MKACHLALSVLATFTACTAETQIGDFVSRQADPNLIFSEDFENGLGKWSQLSGTWTTAAPAPTGSALVSPTATGASSFNLTTVDEIDLTNRSNCELKYDAKFDLSASAGVYAQILFRGNVIAEFKNTSGTAAVSSGTQFMTLRSRLPTGVAGKLTILTGIAASTAADLRIDNMTVTCQRNNVSSVTAMSETFESGVANWSVVTNWAYNASAGQGGTGAMKGNWAVSGERAATFQNTVSLEGRSGCSLNYYYDLAGSTVAASYCLHVYVNNLRMRIHCANGVLASTVSQRLTAFDGLAANQVSFGCYMLGGGGVTCAVDNVNFTCEQ